MRRAGKKLSIIIKYRKIRTIDCVKSNVAELIAAAFGLYELVLPRRREQLEHWICFFGHIV